MHTLVNRWSCQHIDGDIVVIISRDQSWSRLVLSLWDRTLIDCTMHLPDNTDVKACLACLGDLCACGKILSVYTVRSLGYKLDTDLAAFAR
jgi:hypothetical protein